MNLHNVLQNEMQTTPTVNLLPQLACPAAAAFLRAACTEAGPADLPACLAGWLPGGSAAELMQALDAAPAEELQAVLDLQLSLGTASRAGSGEAGDLANQRSLLSNPATSVFGAQALRALQQATAFSFGAERRLAFGDVCERIARLASHAHDVPEQMHEQFMQDMQGAFLPALRAVHSGFVSAGLLEDAEAGERISLKVRRLQDAVEHQQRFQQTLAATKRLGDANGHFTTVLRGALCAFSSRAAAARPADEQAAAGASSGSAAAADEGSSSGSSVGQADAPCLEQCRAELQALAAAHDASGKAIAQTLRRCHGQYDDAALAEEEPPQQKQMLGECLFPRVEALQPELAGKITGMLLELDNIEVLVILTDPTRLKAYVDESVKVLKEAGWQP
ncbi:hypothetical protein COHA_005813 [Chlorella ohadii]|uniref:PABC domain-containing protein n=1 Tax=Chlorella ohadii TaxID=2649997 RepID=A0AAD5H1D5_9CHLO|nr:hypothetical protein COHA_005813 [Chlorella ohadii]